MLLETGQCLFLCLINLLGIETVHVLDTQIRLPRFWYKWTKKISEQSNQFLKINLKVGDRKWFGCLGHIQFTRLLIYLTAIEKYFELIPIRHLHCAIVSQMLSTVSVFTNQINKITRCVQRLPSLWSDHERRRGGRASWRRGETG